MYSVLLIIFGIWLGILSFALVWFLLFFKKFIGKTKERDLLRVLEKILKVQEVNRREIDLVQKAVVTLQKEGQFHLQKVGVVRFNPFAETGGDHSFSLALLDANDSGIVFSCLHTRERTRVYMKAIDKGTYEHDLSREEVKALKVAQKV